MFRGAIMKYMKLLFLLIFCGFNMAACHAKTSESLLKSELIYSYQGTWEGGTDDSTLTVNIYNDGGKFVGNFCSVMRQGTKIDCPESEKTLNMYEESRENNLLKMRITGTYDSKAVGFVYFSLINSNLQWKFSANNGSFFVPVQASLKKVSDNATVLKKVTAVTKPLDFSVQHKNLLGKYALIASTEEGEVGRCIKITQKIINTFQSCTNQTQSGVPYYTCQISPNLSYTIYDSLKKCAYDRDEYF
jgi:hypothetical protein